MTNSKQKIDDIDRKIGLSSMKKVIMQVTVGCDTCFSTQVKNTRNNGISDEEIDEAILVAALIRMGSGLNYTWKTIYEC